MKTILCALFLGLTSTSLSAKANSLVACFISDGVDAIGKMQIQGKEGAEEFVVKIDASEIQTTFKATGTVAISDGIFLTLVGSTLSGWLKTGSSVDGLSDGSLNLHSESEPAMEFRVTACRKL